MSERTALLLGATGLVGGHCLRLLLQEPSYQMVHVIVRKPLAKPHPKMRQHVIDFSQLEATVTQIQADDVFCCLGTTRKQAGSKKEFRKVDYDYPLIAAKAASSYGAKQFLLVSSIGADPKSFFFYNQVKGEIEQAISTLPFESITIFRPSFLLGERKQRRPIESVAKAFMKIVSPLFVRTMRTYKPIEAETVGWAMLRVALEKRPGVHILESARIHALGQ